MITVRPVKAKHHKRGATNYSWARFVRNHVCANPCGCGHDLLSSVFEVALDHVATLEHAKDSLTRHPLLAKRGGAVQLWFHVFVGQNNASVHKSTHLQQNEAKSDTMVAASGERSWYSGSPTDIRNYSQTLSTPVAWHWIRYTQGTRKSRPLCHNSPAGLACFSSWHHRMREKAE